MTVKISYTGVAVLKELFRGNNKKDPGQINQPVKALADDDTERTFRLIGTGTESSSLDACSWKDTPIRIIIAFARYVTNNGGTYPRPHIQFHCDSSDVSSALHGTIHSTSDTTATYAGDCLTLTNVRIEITFGAVSRYATFKEENPGTPLEWIKIDEHGRILTP